MKNVEEGLPAGPLVGAAYGFIWLAVFGFVVWTLRRTSQLEGELAELRERVKQAQGGTK
jgi:CcmD family protein